MTCYANSQGQPLLSHLQAVATNARIIANNVLSDFDKSLKDKIITAAYISGLTHDLGKVEPSFQRYLSGLDSQERYQPETGELYAANNPLHHEISLLLLNYLFDLKKDLFKAESFIKKDIRELKEVIRYAVYWHHPEPKRPNTNLKECLQNYFENEHDLIQELLNLFSSLLPELFDMSPKLDIDDFLDFVDSTQALAFFDTPKKLEHSQLLMKNRKIFQGSLDRNIIKHLTRFALISADRYVSAAPVPDMMNIYEHTNFNDDVLLDAIAHYRDLPDLAGNRTELQIDTAIQLNDYDVTVCQGAAGSGKTRVSLLAYLTARVSNKSVHRGILWVCPRVAIGLGLLEELQESLPTATVGILTGEYKGVWKNGEICEMGDIYDADIVITTVDQVAKSLTSHSSIVDFQHFLERYVVFDEYHELFSIQSLYYVSAIMMRIKECQKDAHILISATPEPLHINLISSIDSNWKFPVTFPSFNEQPIMLSFSIDDCNFNELGCAYIFNTATKAQDTAIASWLDGNTDIMCYHSKFTPIDKAALTSDVLSRFGKRSDTPDSTLYAGPIAQAALNISRQKLVTDCSSPANLLQRIGRANRFGEFGQSYITVLCDSKQVSYGKVKNTGAQKTKLKQGRMVPLWEYYYSNYSFQFYRALLTHLNAKGGPLGTKTCHCQSTLNELSAFYHDFLVKQIDAEGKLVEETFEFINDAVDYLQSYDLYKPVRQTMKVDGDNQIMVSFRGESLWGTMHYVDLMSASKHIGDLIGLPSERDKLVSLSSRDIVDVPYPEYLKQINNIEFQALRTSIKYRAKNLGKRIDEHLQSLSRSQQYPLICSSEHVSNTPSLYYLRAVNDSEESLTVGFKKFTKGLSK